MWCWLAALVVMLGAGERARAQSSQPIEVLVLGTYHFDNPGRDLNNPKADDVLKPERQRELQALANALTEFRPTKVMVERVVPAPDLVDTSYAEFTPAKLSENRNERTQVGYRVANRMGLKTVYGIDEQPGEGEPDYFPFGKVASWAKANGAEAELKAMMATGAAAANQIEVLQKTRSIAGVLAYFNRPGITDESQTIYYDALAFGDTENQPGADLNAMWYLRNAKIFAKLQQVAEPGDRILVVYGMGHNYWLRHFARTARGYRNVDPTPYLEKAAAALP